MKKLEQVKINGLVHAEWNPRGESELQPECVELQKLSASIKKNGLLQPIGVWSTDDANIVIYGNRRMEAARMAGIEILDANVYSGIDEATARILTREENENRFGINPIYDARLLKDAVARGMNQAEIAAASGVSEATICRRMKLVALDGEIVEALEGMNVDTKALEMISSYPDYLQKKAKKSLVDRVKWRGNVKSADVTEIFNGITERITENTWFFIKGVNAADRRDRCKSCAMCSGNQPDLFDEGGDRESRCFESKCFKAMEAQARDELIAEATVGADGIVMCKDRWDRVFQGLKAGKKKKNAPFAYVVWDKWSHAVEVKWGPDPKIAEAAARREKEDREAKARRDEAAAGYNLNLRLSVYEKINRFFFGDAAVDAEAKRQNGLLAKGLRMDALSDEVYDAATDIMIDRLKPLFKIKAESDDKFFHFIFWELGLSKSDSSDDSPQWIFEADAARRTDFALNAFYGALAEKLAWHSYNPTYSGNDYPLGNFVLAYFAREIGITDDERDMVVEDAKSEDDNS